MQLTLYIQEGNIGRLRDRFKRGEDIRRGGSDSEEEAEADFDEEEEEEELEVRLYFFRFIPRSSLSPPHSFLPR